MRQITVSVSRVRTTADGCGRQYHVVTGRGGTPPGGLAGLAAAELISATEIVGRFPSALPESPAAYWHADVSNGGAEPEWRFEVVGLRMAAGLRDRAAKRLRR